MDGVMTAGNGANENESAWRLLRRPEVLRRCGVGKTQLYVMINEGRFPKPVPLGERAVAWLESEVNGWIRERVEARDATTENGSGEKARAA